MIRYRRAIAVNVVSNIAREPSGGASSERIWALPALAGPTGSEGRRGCQDRPLLSRHQMDQIVRAALVDPDTHVFVLSEHFHTG